jgi:hypothetical protein
MRQRAHQQFRTREAMFECRFQFSKNSFHMLLDPIP